MNISAHTPQLEQEFIVKESIINFNPECRVYYQGKTGTVIAVYPPQIRIIFDGEIAPVCINYQELRIVDYVKENEVTPRRPWSMIEIDFFKQHLGVNDKNLAKHMGRSIFEITEARKRYDPKLINDPIAQLELAREKATNKI